MNPPPLWKQEPFREGSSYFSAAYLGTITKVPERKRERAAGFTYLGEEEWYSRGGGQEKEEMRLLQGRYIALRDLPLYLSGQQPPTHETVSKR
jgi:hypothetical protein